MERLIAHPAFPPSSPFLVEVELGDRLIYTVAGPIERLRIPSPARPIRTDELWRHTCFELFVRDADGEGYVEFNFSPSGAWAAYAFDGYRAGMRELEVEAPVIHLAKDQDTLAIHVHLSPPLALSLSKGGLPPPRAHRLDKAGRPSTSSGRTGDRQVGLSAILEDRDGTKSYWALAHPPGKPDFHDPACFALDLPAPPSP